ncbi:MAG: hypothetical protein KC643_23965 [Nitrospira sp.]|nr:hypothetical protein [Nitrospira sp.]MCA9468476.1 hypothetical protein [Nitrospira sp.]
MLFSYKYVPHQMEKMQEFIDFIFFKVWCKAPGEGDFRFELFDANAELKDLMETFCYGDTQGGDFFYGHVESIYNLFAGLTPPQIDQLEQWYQANNDIEKICANDATSKIALYEDITAISPDLSKRLASFFKALYSPQLLDLAALREKIGQIDEHYQAFMHTNTTGKCPFCGLNDIKGMHHTKREAYDHYTFLRRSILSTRSISGTWLRPATSATAPTSSVKTPRTMVPVGVKPSIPMPQLVIQSKLTSTSKNQISTNFPLTTYNSPSVRTLLMRKLKPGKKCME